MGRLDVRGGVSGQSEAALRDQHAVPVQYATRGGDKSATPSRLLPPPSEETSQPVIPSSDCTDDHTYITDDDFQRDLRGYTSVLEPLLGATPP